MINWRFYFPFAFIALVLFVFINAFWLPAFVQHEKQRIIETEKHYVNMLSTTLLPHLLSNDLAEIVIQLDTAKRSRTSYKRIQLFSSTDTQLYPLFDTDEQDTTALSSFRTPLILDGKIYGYIVTYIDIDGLTQASVEFISRLQFVLLLIFASALLIGIYSQYRWISQPLGILANAVSGVAQGNYSEVLPTNLKGDIHEFAISFEQMRSILKSKEAQIDNQYRLQRAVQEIQSYYIADERLNIIFRKVLDVVLANTNSLYGFVGEVLYGQDSHPILKIYAISNLAWNVESRRIYEKSIEGVVEFANPDTLIGQVVVTGRPLVSNHPDTDPRKGGMPPGHPKLENFFGIPIYNRQYKLVGMVGIANSPEAYCESMYQQMDILWLAIGNLIDTRNEKLLRTESSEKLKAVVNGAVDAIVTINEKGIIESFNSAAERTFGYLQTEVIGESVNILMPEMYAKHHYQYMKAYIDGGKAKIIGKEREVTGIRKNGVEFPIELSVSETRIGNKRSFTGILRDITERKQKQHEIEQARTELADANQRLKELAQKDGLTGIFNRRYFDERLADEINRASRQPTYPLTLMILDVDHFKKYNDHYGHTTGDQCLLSICTVMSELFQRKHETVARYGGEEFAIILSNCKPDDGERMAEALLQKVRSLNIEHATSTTASHVTISIGIASMIPEIGTISTDMIDLADSALYQAKEAGRDRYMLAKQPLVSPIN